jgi:hypothetical protein
VLQPPVESGQYRAIRYTQRLADAGAVASVGSVGDSYDNAMAEAFNSLYKAELVRNKGPWRGIDDLELATVEYIDWSGQQPTPARRTRTHPTRRTRGTTRDDPPSHRNPENQIIQSPSNQGLDSSPLPTNGDRHTPTC